ncbi:MAG: YihY family inner membrane protein [Planctomycetes bacterium]|nr:YihY family inner membrane protein [Planctomycetota bacterium]
MIQRYVRATTNWLKRVVTQPRHELDRWQKAVRFMYELGHYGARQLRNDRAPQMAAALAFRALFALFPVLVVATIVVRAVIGIDEFVSLVDGYLAQAHLQDVKLVLPAETGASVVSLRQWLENLIGQAASINLAAVGWIGLVVVIYAAIGLMVTIENAFNLIYRAPEGRAWTRRVPLYWFVLTVSPVAMGVAAYVNGRFEEWIASVEAWQWVLVAARFVWSTVWNWLVLFAIYTLIPNTRVEARPALIGSFLSLVLLHIGMRSLGAYFQNAFSFSRLYGSLGLIPLFMFWTYLMWLALLFGLEVSATLQMLRGRRLEEIEPRRHPVGLIDPAAVIGVMQAVAQRFAAGDVVTDQQIAKETGLPQPTVARIVDELVSERLLHRVDSPDRAFCLSRPPERIAAEELLRVGFALADEQYGRRPFRLLDRFRRAQRQAAAGLSLASLLAETGAS